MVTTRPIMDSRALTNGPLMVLDYQECESTEMLVQVLNDLAANCFLLEKVIPQPGETYVVLFRRRAYG